MKRILRLAAMSACLVAACGAVAHAAQEVPVGRITLQLPGDAWRVYAMNDADNVLEGSGVTYKQRTESKIFVRGAGRTIEAVLIVQANETGKGRFSGVSFPDARCDGGSGIFAEGDQPGPAARSFRCLRVLPPHDVTGAVDENIKALLVKDGWTWPPAMHVMLAAQYANTGAFVNMTTLVSPVLLKAFPEKATEVKEALPQGVSAASVQWGRLLQDAVTDSVYSIRGKLPLPELSLVNAADSVSPATAK